MNLMWLLRMTKWVRNPPSAQRVRFGLIIIAVCVAVFAAEWAGLLPDWFALDPKNRIR